jgi:hypothetical protein
MAFGHWRFPGGNIPGNIDNFWNNIFSSFSSTANRQSGTSGLGSGGNNQKGSFLGRFVKSILGLGALGALGAGGYFAYQNWGSISTSISSVPWGTVGTYAGIGLGTGALGYLGYKTRSFLGRGVGFLGSHWKPIVGGTVGLGALGAGGYFVYQNWGSISSWGQNLFRSNPNPSNPSASSAPASASSAPANIPSAPGGIGIGTYIGIGAGVLGTGALGYLGYVNRARILSFLKGRGSNGTATATEASIPRVNLLNGWRSEKATETEVSIPRINLLNDPRMARYRRYFFLRKGVDFLGSHWKPIVGGTVGLGALGAGGYFAYQNWGSISEWGRNLFGNKSNPSNEGASSAPPRIGSFLRSRGSTGTDAAIQTGGAFYPISKQLNTLPNMNFWGRF